MKWVGWCWQPRGWRRVCEALTIGECAHLLERASKRLKVPGRLQVLTTGAPPTFTPKESSCPAKARSS
jgi:hypothetical protein